MRRFFLMTVLVATVAMGFGCGTSDGSVKKDREVPGGDLFTQHGWVIAGEVNESRDTLPPDFKLRSGYFPWVIFLDLSRDIGLDFTPHAGKEVRVLRFRIRDKQGERLKDIVAKYDLQGVILYDNDQVIGAWITYTAKDGTRLRGNPGYSLKAKDLEQITGTKWPEYATRHSPVDPRDIEQAVRERARLVMQALQASDGKRLADLGHPRKGVRFSPYAFVHTEKDGDMVLTPSQLRDLDSDQVVYRWGIQDGNGKPIERTLAGYLKRFATRDYLTTDQVGYNQIIKQGNTRVNIHEAYPDGMFIEFHLPGTGEHADFTWSSVRLVFEQDKGTWYLVGVINDQWTI